MVVVVDSEDRENEGDLILAAEHATPQNIAFMLRHCSGLICASLPPPLLDHLQLPLMLPPESNSDTHRTAYSLPVVSPLLPPTPPPTFSVPTPERGVPLSVGQDAAVDGSGISAAERAHTLRLLAWPEAQPQAFRKPGHVFPLRSHPGTPLLSSPLLGDRQAGRQALVVTVGGGSIRWCGWSSRPHRSCGGPGHAGRAGTSGGAVRTHAPLWSMHAAARPT